MKGLSQLFCRISGALAMCVCASSVMAAQAPNPRSVALSAQTSRNSSKVISRSTTNRENGDVSVVSRGAVMRRTDNDAVSARAAKNTVARSGGLSRSAVGRSATVARSGVINARSGAGTNVSRSALPMSHKTARSASNVVNAGVARLASGARATAVFSDVSKIGGGYAQCRESYATCMDQFCANANDTYRRCYCSSKFTEFRDTEASLDDAKMLLQKFEDNNLNAVDKTAAEVNAMYSASIGEDSIKNDVSGAQSILGEVGDLLNGKKKSEEEKTELRGLIDVDDIWGENSNPFDVFDQGETDVVNLEGLALYNQTHNQCLQVVGDACTNDATLKMATSAYNIMINQDCNLFEKKIDTQRESLMKTVRQAEKYLREARLEEYRAHNSQDVNECIAKVKDALMADVACGENYKRCLDYSGKYINTTTGEPIYSADFYNLGKLIDLTDSSDSLAANPNFDKFLEEKRMFANTALDSCRDLADVVWREFKRSALIEISQAQDEKIEQVKDSCISTVTQCYDTQTGQWQDMHENSAQSSGAIAASAARMMCKDKVNACAILYPGGKDDLIALVNTVDTLRIAEGCTTALTNYVQNELCAPAANESGRKYPWGCRDVDVDDLNTKITNRAKVYCKIDNKDNGLSFKSEDVVNNLIAQIKSELQVLYDTECNAVGGIWVESGETADSTYVKDTNTNYEQKFYSALVGGIKDRTIKIDSYGYCYANSLKIQCEMQNTATNGLAKYDEVAGKCVFEPDWYKNRCEFIGGYYENDTCYINTSTSNQ